MAGRADAADSAQVAIKLIKAGMDTAQVIARFETERQTLALMDHPGIATVFDAGTTPQGRPYFAMEYVRGEPITTYCDRHRHRPGNDSNCSSRSAMPCSMRIRRPLSIATSSHPTY